MARRPTNGMERMSLDAQDIERRLRVLESGHAGSLAASFDGNSYLQGGGDLIVDGGQFIMKTANGDFALSPFSMLVEHATASPPININTSDTLVVSRSISLPSWAGNAVVLAFGSLAVTENSSGANGGSAWVEVGGVESESMEFGVTEQHGAFVGPVFAQSYSGTVPSSVTCRLEAVKASSGSNFGVGSAMLTVFAQVSD